MKEKKKREKRKEEEEKEENLMIERKKNMLNTKRRKGDTDYRMRKVNEIRKVKTLCGGTRRCEKKMNKKKEKLKRKNTNTIKEKRKFCNQKMIFCFNTHLFQDILMQYKK